MSLQTELPQLEANNNLLAALDGIAVAGWNSRPANELLDHVRAHVVRPQVFALGLRGPAAEQAESTAWALAWEILNKPSLRETESPWGVLWVAVRRAIQGEMLAAAYQTSERKSWCAYRAQSAESTPPISLTVLSESGWEPAAAALATPHMGPGLQSVAAALVKVGWERRAAHAVVHAVASTVARKGNTAGITGWRGLAARLDLPPWQVRRVAKVLLGRPGWPGAVERMATRGAVCLEDADMKAALAATLDRSRLPGGNQNPISEAS